MRISELRPGVGFMMLGALLAACALRPAPIPIHKGTAAPGGVVTRRGLPVRLVGNPITVGQPLPPTRLTDAATGEIVDLSRELGKVLLLSLVVSLDTGL